MQPTSKKLEEYYFSQKTNLTKLVEEFEDADLDGPLLMYCRDDLYENAPHKILFIGQEHNGWYGGITDDITALLKQYEWFEMGKANNRRGTPFWKGVFHLNSLVNPDQGQDPCFLWTNVSKYSTTEGKPILTEEHKKLLQKINYLPQEIKIVAPDTLIFFSGPDYDEKIAAQFEGEITQTPVDERIPSRELARLHHPALPANTFRTYHPSSLQRQGKWNYLNLIAFHILGIDYSKIQHNFLEQLNKLVSDNDLTIDFYPSKKMLGTIDSCFWLTPKQWQHCAVGFGFDYFFDDFFYGICRKELSKDIPSDVAQTLVQALGQPDGHNEGWPWWKWHPQKRWSYDTMKNMDTNQFIADIQTRLQGLIQKLDGRKL